MRHLHPILFVLLLTVLSVAARADPLDDPSRNSLSWQIALEREGFSPGILDAKPGPKLLRAVSEFQRSRGLPPTPGLNDSAASALEIDDLDPLKTHTIDTSDLASVTGPTPKTWPAKSEAKSLGYQSLIESLAERFHCTQALLERLNPGRDINKLQAGATLLVPSTEAPDLPRIHRLEINQLEKVIRGYDALDRHVLLLHCSIAEKQEKRPAGQARVLSITTDPVYRFDPVMWTEVKGVDRILMIPPGPRNPVGRCWIALSFKGYGIHGTPNPELIGKTGSHGCIRLANWDALRLGRAISPGTPVTFISTATPSPKSGKPRIPQTNTDSKKSSV